MNLRFLSVFRRLSTLERQMEYAMSALSDLQSAEAALGQSVSAAVADIAALTAKLASTPTDDSAALQALTADITAKVAALNTAVNPPAPTV